jgi:hypothetical protein
MDSEVLGFWTLSIFRISKYKKAQQHFGNWICFHPHVSGGRHLLCWVPSEDVTSITGRGVSPSHLRPEAGRVSEMFFLVFRIKDDGQSPETQYF